MAMVAEQVGQQPIDFKTGAGEVIKGAGEAAGLYGALQKAEATKLEIENMKIKQDSMKSGIFLDYMTKIANSPNPAVQKVLKKQYGMQHEKMYGQPMDAQTLEAITNSPNFSEAMSKLVEDFGLEGTSADAVNKIAQSLGLPYVDAQKLIEDALKAQSEERIAGSKAEAAKSKADIYASNVRTDNEMQAIKFEQETAKDIENRKSKLVPIENALRIANNLEKLRGNPKSRDAVKEQVVLDDQLITAYTKMQDPTSVVMPSEVLRTMQTQPKFDQLNTYINKEFKRGGLLDPKQRVEMAKYLKMYADDQVTKFNKYRGGVAGRVKRAGGDPSSIMGDNFAPQQQQQQAQVAPKKKVMASDLVKQGKSLEEINDLIKDPDRKMTPEQYKNLGGK